MATIGAYSAECCLASPTSPLCGGEVHQLAANRVPPSEAMRARGGWVDVTLDVQSSGYVGRRYVAVRVGGAVAEGRLLADEDPNNGRLTNT